METFDFFEMNFVIEREHVEQTTESEIADGTTTCTTFALRGYAGEAVDIPRLASDLREVFNAVPGADATVDFFRGEDGERFVVSVEAVAPADKNRELSAATRRALDVLALWQQQADAGQRLASVVYDAYRAHERTTAPL